MFDPQIPSTDAFGNPVPEGIEIAPRNERVDDGLQSWRSFWKKNGLLVQGISLTLLAGLFFIGTFTYFQQKRESDKKVAAIVTDIANSRFTNTKKSCDTKNADNLRIHRVLLALTPKTATKAERAKGEKILEAAWPTKVNCEDYAFKLICTAQQRLTLPACILYLRNHPDIKENA